MKKIVWTFGLIGGAISAAMMWLTIPFAHQIGYDRALIVGYTTIVLSSLMVFFGIRSYRDNVNGGSITFGRAFTVGLSITVITCVCYVVSWEILYYNFLPNFMDEYAAQMTQQLKASGSSPEYIRTQLEGMDKMKELYKNPLYNVAMTFIEPFPVGLLFALGSAGILRKKPA